MRLRKKESDREQSKIDSTTPHGEEIGWRQRLALGADVGRRCRRYSGLRTSRQSFAAAACCKGDISGPSVEKISLGEKSGTFAFCGRSGLNNCVADGNTFWMKGVKMQLAGIEVPQIDRARCMEERQRGFIAKVRLRDMLNAGAFDVASSAAAGGQATERKRLSRSGVSFADQLIREGLAHPISAKNQSWCG